MCKGVGDTGCVRGGSKRRILPESWLRPHATGNTGCKLHLRICPHSRPGDWTLIRGTPVSHWEESSCGTSIPRHSQLSRSAGSAAGRPGHLSLRPLRWGRPAPQLAPPPCSSSSKVPSVSSLESSWGPRELPDALFLGNCDFFS